MKVIALVVLLLLLLSPVWAQHPYQVGETVQDFTLQNAQGDSVALSDYANHIMFLVFWMPG